MFRHKRILGLITARGGSKGVPHKNIRPLAGKPLIVWTIDVARASAYIDDLILSTDCPEIAQIAARHGCDVPFMRPGELATDSATHVDVCRHAIENAPRPADLLVLLQPTSPLRTEHDIDACIRMCVEHRGRTVASVGPVQKTPFWMFRLGPDQGLEPFLDADLRRNRQHYGQLYALNGAVYVLDIARFLRREQITDPDALGYVMPSERSVDIDDELDFAYCETLMRRSHSLNPVTGIFLKSRQHGLATVAD